MYFIDFLVTTLGGILVGITIALALFEDDIESSEIDFVWLLPKIIITLLCGFLADQLLNMHFIVGFYIGMIGWFIGVPYLLLALFFQLLRPKIFPLAIVPPVLVYGWYQVCMGRI